MIHFYYMENCGYCAKAKQVLASEIASGMVVIKDAKEATGVSGFPHFVSTTTGATHTGFMPDKEKLFEKLGVKQNKQAHVNQNQHAQPQAHVNQNQRAQPQAHVNQNQHSQPQSKKEIENGSSLRGGYLSLSETWVNQKRYVA